MSQRNLYTMGVLAVPRTYMITLAAIVATFVALYPYLASTGSCETGKCPYAVQSSQGAAGAGACVAVLAASSAVSFAFAAFRRHRLPAIDRRPAQLYLSPDPPPPRLS